MYHYFLCVIVALLFHKEAYANQKADLQNITIYADSSLAPPLSDIIHLYTRTHGRSFIMQYGPIKELKESAAGETPPDIFISMFQESLQELVEKKAYRFSSPNPIASNYLVIGAYEEHPALTQIQAQKDWLSYVNEHHKLVIVDPDIEPLGDYSKIALEKLGWWSTHEDQRLYAYNRQIALQMLDKSTNLGILYISDVILHPSIFKLSKVPQDLYPTIRYYAITHEKASKEALDFQQFLTSHHAQEIWKKYDMQ